MDIKLLYYICVIYLIINVVSANYGIFGYDGFATQKLKRIPMEKESECVSWDIASSGDAVTDHFATVEIKPGCTTGIKIEYSSDSDSDSDYFSPFQYYSDLEIDLIILNGQLDIRMEESSTGDYVILKSFDESEFTEDLIQNYNFTSYVCPFPENLQNSNMQIGYSVINFSNPNPDKSVKFYMRKVRLVHYLPRPVLDNLKLYGNDWSYNWINSSFVNNVMYKYLHAYYGCISIDLKEPYVEPWASVRFEVKAPENFVLYTGMEIEGVQSLTTIAEGYTFNEEEWTTVEIEFKDILYDKLYDRLDICNGSDNISWIKIRNIYFEPKYKYELKTKAANLCCSFNNCICTVQFKKVYVRRNATNSIPDSQLNNNKDSDKNNSSSLIFTHSISLISNLLLISLILLFI